MYPNSDWKHNKYMGKIRIIGGVHRSRILKFKDGIDTLRPTPDRVRETLFNWLHHDLTGKRCLDLFAGSGALGFEAISQGALSVTMVENNRQVMLDLKANKLLLKSDNVDLVGSDALVFLKSTVTTFDLIFLDPPYSTNLLTKCLQQITTTTHLLSRHGMIYIEYQELPDLAGYTVIKSGKASMVNYALITKTVDQVTLI